MNTWVWSIDGWIVLVGILSALSCALPGNFLVLRRLSLMGDAISHAVLPGLAIAFLLTQSRAPLPMFIGAAVVGVLTATLTHAIHRYGKVEHGAAMGVVFSVLFAIGLVLIRRGADSVDLDPGCVLYGNMVNVGLYHDGGVPGIVVNLGIALAVNVAFIGLFYKELKICAFDPDLATTLGINANVMHYALMVVVAMTTVANFEAVGSILVIAMLIVPAAAAHLLTDRLWLMIVLSAVVALLSAVVGYAGVLWGPGLVGLDARFSPNPAAMMASTAGVFFLLALLFSPQYGIISRVYHRAALSVQIAGEDVLGLLYRWQEMRPRADEPMGERDLVQAVGGGWLTGWTLRTLRWRRAIKRVKTSDGEPSYVLSPAGVQSASHLVRAHRLWETYLAKHFHLPADHLHMPAERMEHYLSPELTEQIVREVEHADQDPHGRDIPGPA